MVDSMLAARVSVAVVLALVWAAAGIVIAPCAFEAQSLLDRQEDPLGLADHAIAR